MKIHNIFHIDLLTPFTQTLAYGPLFSRPPPDLINDEEHYKIDEIIDVRKKGHNRRLEYLVHWKGYFTSERSWVPQNDLNAPELLKQFQNKPISAKARQ
jgi:hypothetical protein